MKIKPTCAAVAEFCTADAMVKGYCLKHYERVKRHGNPYIVGSGAKPGDISINIPVYDPSMAVMDAFVYARRRVEAYVTKKHAVICGPMIMNITPERHGATNAAFTVVATMRLERAT